jgi:ABC-type uncharacterized transport system substrate-binding protein
VAGFGTETAKAAQAAATTIPIIFTSVGDPVAAGIVKSLRTECSQIIYPDPIRPHCRSDRR